jgi:nicotinate-nucleotide adenylyltransferase
LREREAVGVLGGSFDPVHLGHLEAAVAVRDALGLGRVWLLPCAQPPHKPHRALAPVEHRLAMLRLAIADRERVELDTTEVERGGISYTIDTLRALGGRPSPVAPVFILGSDGLAELPSWKDWQALVAEFDLAAVARPRHGLPELGERLPAELGRRIVAPGPDGRFSFDTGRPGSGGRIFFIPARTPDISSSLVRSRAARGDSLDGLVPPEVARYIERWRLYREEASS